MFWVFLSIPTCSVTHTKAESRHGHLIEVEVNVFLWWFSCLEQIRTLIILGHDWSIIIQVQNPWDSGIRKRLSDVAYGGLSKPDSGCCQRSHSVQACVSCQPLVPSWAVRSFPSLQQCTDLCYCDLLEVCSADWWLGHARPLTRPCPSIFSPTPSINRYGRHSVLGCVNSLATFRPDL